MSATVLNSCNLSFYQLQSYLHSWNAANRSSKENLSYGTAPSPSKCPPQPQSLQPGAADKSGASSSNVEMDKAKFKAQLLDLVRDNFQFEQNARVTLLMSVHLDDRPNALNLEVSEELLAKPAAPAAPVTLAGVTSGSKRKSQAPQRMVPSGEEDSFVPASAATAAPSRDASSSFNADLSAAATEDEEPQPLNLSRNGSPAVGSSSTPLKSIPTPAAAAAFQLNNPEFHQHRQYIAAAAGYPVVSRAADVAVMSAVTAPTVMTPSASASSMANGAKLHSIASSGLQQPRPMGVRSRRPGNRTFPCNQCGIVFQSLAGLSKHTFTTHKVYKCTFCGANFTQRSNLQRHSLKHVGFKPFECRCCRKSYYRKDHLVRHIEVTHPGHDPKLSIDTRLSSAECLQYLERKHESRDYTSLSGVVLSAAAAAAAVAEVGDSAVSEAPAATSGTEDEIDETEELGLMMDGEMGEEYDEAQLAEEGDEDEPMYDEAGIAEAEEDAEIDVGLEEPQPILLEQPVAE